MDVERWKEKLSLLDFERECSEPVSKDSSYETTPDFDELDTPYDTTFFTVWLPRKHICVQQLKLTRAFPDFNEYTIPDLTSPSNLRCISILGNASFEWALLLNALGPIEQLEGLEVNDLVVSVDLASTIAELVLNCAHCIKVFELFVLFMHCTIADILMSNLPKCKELTELTFVAGLSSVGVRDFITLLRSTETLKKLYLSVQLNYGEANWDENNEKLLRTVGDLLRRNTTLTELRYQGELLAIPGILNALESNTEVKRLALDDCNIGSKVLRRTTGTALMSILRRNKGLSSLTIEGLEIDYIVAGPISEGLKQNTTLECLDLTDCTVSFSALRELCSVFSVNRTLRSLKVGPCELEDTESRELAADLARMQCYGRLQMHWTHWDAPGLSCALLKRSLCPTKRHLDISLFLDESFSIICKAVASSVHLKELEVHFREVNNTRVKSLCDALAENESLQRISLCATWNSQSSSALVAHSLRFHKSVTQLKVYCRGMDEAAADMFASLLLANESMWKFEITSMDKVGSPFGSLRAPLERNLAHLRMAARFVLKKNRKMFAEAFEHFQSKEQLLRCVTVASDMNEAEARVAEKAAELFVRRNYFHIKPSGLPPGRVLPRRKHANRPAQQ
ncbi:hypothetical protein HPB48_021565 [Haemaphysalis longicornis]|uniref:Uncharacterized protein n=1 Tax=Haemaphysalis longicornis TaxID=44386 RepID=A0A9J6FPL7_HAELO|nr:hypothetical protein HPB48_021565 [Haemaphysalis longicornis]